MPTVEWQGKVRVVVGELTRGDQLALWREVAEITSDDSSDNVTVVRLINDTITRRATRAVYVCVDGDWQRADDKALVEIVIDDAHYTLTLPISSAALDELPASLADAWVTAAATANQYLRDQLFTSERKVETGKPSAMTSEPPLDAGPSNAVVSET